MNKLKIYDRLLKYMYEEYNAGHSASGHGERVSVLIDHFERISASNRIGDAHEKKAAVNYLHKNGWISVVDTLGKQVRNSNRAYVFGRMQPTEKGREYLHKRKTEAVTKVASPIAEVVGSFFKGWRS